MSSDRLRNGIGNRGMALLLVVSVISLLTVIILQFNRSMRENLIHSHHFRERDQLYSIVESGVDVGIALIHSDSYYNDFDCLQDPWARAAENVITDLGGGSELTVTITDLSGRFQVSSLVEITGEKPEKTESNRLNPEVARDILLRLLVSGDFSIEGDLQAREIVDSLVDWLDSDDNESDYGAENSYYESLEYPYSTRNGFMESPNELLAVKGITPDILYGKDEKIGLADYITVFGTDSKININTADTRLLSALHKNIVRDDAELLVAYRDEENSVDSLGNRSWYKTVPGWPNNIEFEQDLVTTASSFFKIEAAANLGDMQMKMTAYVKRSEKKALEILYRKLH